MGLAPFLELNHCPVLNSKKTKLRANGLYTWLKIKNKWKCITIKEIIFQYRRHENNMSNNEANLFQEGKPHIFLYFKKIYYHQTHV